MQSPHVDADQTGEFLLRKTIFLLTSSVGNAMAETLVRKAVFLIGVTPATLKQDDVPRLSSALEPTLREFVGNEKAARLASALRVMVGGVAAA